MQQVASGFIMKKNKFLFGKRSKWKKWAPGLWDIVGGHALPGEEPLETLKRETIEETGIKVLQAKWLTSIDVADESDKHSFKFHIYMITAWTGKARNCSDEHNKIRWLTRSQFAKRKQALPVYLQLVDEWFQRIVLFRNDCRLFAGFLL